MTRFICVSMDLLCRVNVIRDTVNNLSLHSIYKNRPLKGQFL